MLSIRPRCQPEGGEGHAWSIVDNAEAANLDFLVRIRHPETEVIAIRDVCLCHGERHFHFGPIGSGGSSKRDGFREGRIGPLHHKSSQPLIAGGVNGSHPERDCHHIVLTCCECVVTTGTNIPGIRVVWNALGFDVDRRGERLVCNADGRHGSLPVYGAEARQRISGNQRHWIGVKSAACKCGD